jgi:hypothetical protein
MSKVFLTIFTVFCALVLLLGLRGLAGVPKSEELNDERWKENGPFELSPERGRFALLYSLLEDHSFQFSRALADFSEPDVAILNGRFVSLFAPGLSLLSIPGYLLGKLLGLSQVGTVAVVPLIALVNILLIRAIAVRLGANPVLASLSSLAFIFGTPAFTYAVTFYQHHLSLLLLLSATYLLITRKSLWADFLVWMLLAFSFLVDYPNLIMGLPVAIFTFSRLVTLKAEGENYVINFKLLGMSALFAMFIPAAILLWFNQQSYGNAWQLSGTLARTKDIGAKGKSVLTFFNSRDLPNGFYTHLLSPDRGMLFYAPISLLGIIGVVLAYRKKVPYTSLLISLSGTNLLLYSLWDDPWGGWAFGSRYLIPSYAVMAIFSSLLLTHWRKKWLFLVFFLAVFCYSSAVNTLGALTSSKNPPLVEILSLEKITNHEEKYTYARNWDYLSQQGTKSFVYQTYFVNRLSPKQYYLTVLGIITSAGLGLLIYHWIFQRKPDEHKLI